MTLEFNCHQCNARIATEDDMAGKDAMCPHCHAVVKVPLWGIHPGMTIGDFEVIRRLGVGGMGEVWLARQTSMDREVALKVLSPVLTNEPGFVDRFLNEVKTSAKLEHPHIVTAYYAGVQGPINYMATSFVDGEELEQRLRREGPIPEKEALKICRCVVDALNYAWSKFNLIHRDIKPGNIMLSRDGEIKIMDVGISKLGPEDRRGDDAEFIEGTPHYMSPEQAQGIGDLDFRSDIYSLGIMLFQMVTGTLPFDSPDQMEIIRQHLQDPLPSPQDFNPHLSSGCVDLILVMTAKNREQRQADWDTVIQAIDKVQKLGRKGVMSLKITSNIKLPMPAPLNAEPAAVILPTRRKRRTRESSSPYFLIVVVLAIVTLGIFLLSHDASRSTSAPSVTNRETRVRETERDRRHDQASQAWKQAMEYARQNPDNLAEARRRFEAMKSQHRSAEFSVMADTEIAKIDKQLKERIAATMDGLRSQAESLLEQEQYEDAAQIMTAYDGPFKNETLSQRQDLVRKYRAMAKEQSLAETDSRLQTDQRLKTLKPLLAGAILGGDLRKAITLSEEFVNDAKLIGDKSEIQDVVHILNQFTNINKVLMNSFKEDEGKEIDITLSGRKHRLLIRSVSDKNVSAVKKLGGASSYFTIMPQQLAPDEKLRRLHANLPPSVFNLYLALLYNQRGDYEKAVTAFQNTGVLVEPICDQLKLKTTEQQEKAAEAVIKKVLYSLSLPVGPDSDGLSEKLAQKQLSTVHATAMKKKLLEYSDTYGDTETYRQYEGVIELLSEYLDEQASHTSQLETTVTFGRGSRNMSSWEKKAVKAREQGGTLIRCGPKPGGEILSLEAALSKFKAGDVLHFTPGQYGELVIENMQNCVIEGEGNVQATINLERCRNIVVRNMHGIKLLIKDRCGDVMVVDCMLPIAVTWPDCDDTTFYNCCIDVIINIGETDAHHCTVKAIGADTVEGKLALTDCVVAGDGYQTPHLFRVYNGIRRREETTSRARNKIYLTHCLINPESPVGYRVGSHESLSEPRPQSVIETFNDIDAMDNFVRLRHCEIATPKFVDNYTLADDSPGKADASDGRDMGAIMDSNGQPVGD